MTCFAITFSDRIAVFFLRCATMCAYKRRRGRPASQPPQVRQQPYAEGRTMQDLSDRPVLRKRRMLARLYCATASAATMRGDALFFSDAYCPRCETWPTRRVDDKSCCGCNGGGPYAGTRANPRTMPKRQYDKKIGRGADPTRITPDGKLILTPAKHWHKAYR